MFDTHRWTLGPGHCMSSSVGSAIWPDLHCILLSFTLARSRYYIYLLN